MSYYPISAAIDILNAVEGYRNPNPLDEAIFTRSPELDDYQKMVVV